MENEIVASFNPKPEAMAAGAMCGQSIPLPAIASGFGLNEACGHFRLASMYSERRNGKSIARSAESRIPSGSSLTFGELEDVET